MAKKYKILIIIPAIICLLIIGAVITKLTVRDLALVNQRLKRCADSAVKTHYNNPFERLALYFGKSRIVSVLSASVEIESFTMFHTPLGILWGQPNTKLGVFCNLTADWGLKNITDLYLLSPDEVPPGWYFHRLNDERIILTKQETLPDVSNTGNYVYGDQINISVYKFNEDLQRPEECSQLAWTDDETLVKEKFWTYVGSMTALRVKHETGGMSGGQITWYLFNNNKVYGLSLYLPNDLPNDETFSDFVYHYGQQISKQDAITQSLAEQLAECLPKSDMTSHEKCNELLKQITNFDNCVIAGFSIMKSNPSQCATPDGRIFIQVN
jgi:hypothetical protein